MPIVSSIVTEDRQQIDGRRSIVERHVDHLGVEYSCFYMAEAHDDAAASLAARAAQIEADLAAAEIAANLAEARLP